MVGRTVVVDQVGVLVLVLGVEEDLGARVVRDEGLVEGVLFAHLHAVVVVGDIVVIRGDANARAGGEEGEKKSDEVLQGYFLSIER